MILQPPQPVSQIGKKYFQPRTQNTPDLCHRCGAQIIFDRKLKAPSGKLIPLDPFFNNQPHKQYCMYATTSANAGADTEAMLLDFISLVPNQPLGLQGPKTDMLQQKRKVLFAVGKARDNE
jgi:hypothetical protein